MITAKELISILGKPLTDPKTQGVLAKITCAQKRSNHQTTRHYIYKDYGLEVVEDASNGRVRTVFLHGKNRSFAAYGGELPEKLKLGMSQDDVRGLLGEPDKDFGDEDQWDKGPYRIAARYGKKATVDSFYLTAT